jgi:hypothetical protein
VRRLWCEVGAATSGRSCSLANTDFFEAELLGVNEVPHCLVIDFEAAPGELGDEPAQGEVFFLNP